ncbi:MAG: hypothetical protein ACRD0I_10085 [Acidimicrobiales bacterium]
MTAARPADRSRLARAASGAPAHPAQAPSRSRPPLRILGDDRAQLRARRRRARLLVVAGGAMAIICLFGVVVAHVVITQNQFRLDHMTAQLSQAKATHDNLRLEAATLQAPARIVSTAQAHGMVRPPTLTYLAPVSPPVAAKAGSTATTRR